MEKHRKILFSPKTEKQKNLYWAILGFLVLWTSTAIGLRSLGDHMVWGTAIVIGMVVSTLLYAIGYLIICIPQYWKEHRIGLVHIGMAIAIFAAMIFTVVFFTITMRNLTSGIETLEAKVGTLVIESTTSADDLLDAFLSQTTQAEEIRLSQITQTEQAIKMATMQATIDYQATQIATLTPEPEIKSIEDLPMCDFEKMNYPCQYWTQLTDYYSFSGIAKKAYKNESFAGRIAELYRNEEGKIPIFKSDRLIIIPDHSQPQDESYYELHFGLLEYPISKCVETNPGFPCWLISSGESYDVMAGYYPIPVETDCIKQSNKTEWKQDLAKLEPKSPQVGAIFVLPVCP